MTTVNVWINAETPFPKAGQLTIKHGDPGSLMLVRPAKSEGERSGEEVEQEEGEATTKR